MYLCLRKEVMIGSFDEGLKRGGGLSEICWVILIIFNKQAEQKQMK